METNRNTDFFRPILTVSRRRRQAKLHSSSVLTRPLLTSSTQQGWRLHGALSPTITLTETQIPESWDRAPCVNDTDAQDHRDCVPQPAPATPADYLDNLDFRLMYRLAYRNFGGNPVQESLVGISRLAAARVSPAMGRFVGTSSETREAPLPLRRFFRPAPMTRTPTIAGWDRLRWTRTTTSRSATANRACLPYPASLSLAAWAQTPPTPWALRHTVHAGIGVQTAGAGNRWGDYSAMTVDPVDQCTFYYTNEYLHRQTAGSIGRRASHLPVPILYVSAPAWGTLTGTVRSSPSSRTLSGVIVTLSNGYAGATNANGVYSFLVPPGTYTATAADADRNCTCGLACQSNRHHHQRWHDDPKFHHGRNFES